MKIQQKNTYKQRQKYAIRKLSVGIASVLFGTFCYLGQQNEASAAEGTNNGINNLTNAQQNGSSVQQNNQTGAYGVNNHVPAVPNNQNTVGSNYNNAQQPNANDNAQASVNRTADAKANQVTGGQQVNNQPDNQQQSLPNQATPQPNPNTQQHAANQAGNHNDNVTTPNNTQETERVKRSVENTPATPPATPKATFNETIILPQTNARPVQVKEVREQVYRKSVGVLKTGKKAQTLGANRGINQARESLGFVVPANTNLYVRQVKGNKAGNLRVNLVTNDSHYNKTATVNSNGTWTKINTIVDSAAFIYMPRGLDNEPQIEYYVENNLGKALPTYRKGWNQKLFERRWTEEDSSYAYVEGTHHALLIPKMDRHHIINMKNNKAAHQFKSLDELINYYDDMISHYNKWAGLNDDVNSVNFNNQSKYFIVANRHGGGLAYYTGDHVATNSPSIGYFLNKGWLALHEVGHGYDGIMTSDARIPLLEVWNNIFANEYQKNIEKSHHGWLYGTNQRQFQAGIHKRMLQNNLKFDIQKASLKERLEFMTRMVRLTGIEGLTAMLQDVREEQSKKKVGADLPRWFSENWLAKYNANTLAYFDLYNIPVTNGQKDRIEALQQTYIYPLALLINNEAERQRYVKKLGLATEYELVRSSDLADTNVKTNAEVNLQLNGHTLAEDAVVKLVDGQHVVAEAKIQNGIAQFQNIRPGVYKVVAPHSADKALPSHTFLIVREGNANNFTVSYPNSDEKQSFYNQRLAIKGIGNREFVGINYNPGIASVTIQKYAGVPHNYYNNEYAHIKIVKQNGEVLLDESIVGSRNLAAKVQKFQLSYGDKIIVKHREPNSRRTLLRIETNEKIEVPFPKNETVTYTLTDKGFKVNDEADYRVSGRYTTAVIADVQRFENDLNNNPDADYRVRLSNIVRSINQLDEQYRELILQRVKPYFDKFNLS
jgi:hypothetical protein